MSLGRESFLPLLIDVVHLTQGSIVELGCGNISTTFLHWACYNTKRKLVSCENDPKYYGWAKRFECNYHQVRFVENWDDVDLSGNWSVAFVDHTPKERRAIDIKRLVHAEYVVVHDAEPREEHLYNLNSIRPLFKYSKTDTTFRNNRRGVHTLLLSNFYDLSNFSIQ